MLRTVQLTSAFYTAIVAITILDHIAQEEGRNVAESISDALKPGGFAFIETFTIYDPGATLSKEEDEAISETAHSFIHSILLSGRRISSMVFQLGNRAL